jgi:hypothetical protein
MIGSMADGFNRLGLRLRQRGLCYFSYPQRPSMNNWFEPTSGLWANYFLPDIMPVAQVLPTSAQVSLEVLLEVLHKHMPPWVFAHV